MAIIWACEEFRSLIDSVPFDVETDHGSLRWLLETKTPGRLNRWALRLQEFIPFMTIKYKPGPQNGPPDALSRCPLHRQDVAEICACDPGKVSTLHEELHTCGALTRNTSEGAQCACARSVCSVETLAAQIDVAKAQQRAAAEEFVALLVSDGDVCISAAAPLVAVPEYVPGGPWARAFRDQQEADSFCGPMVKFLRGELKGGQIRDLARQADNFVLHKGLLYKWVKLAPSKRRKRPGMVVLRVVVPHELQETVLQLTHSAPAAGHAKKGKMGAVVRRRFWWKGLNDDVARYIRSCPDCQLAQRMQPRHHGLLQSKVVNEVNELVSIDYIGPFPIGKDRNIMVLTIVDAFSRWPVLVPTHSTTAEVTADLVWEHWISVYGIPKRIISDQGPQFESELFARVCESLGIDKARTTAYHPQTNAQAERFHRYLLPTLVALVGERSSDWVDYLSYVVFAYRCYDVAGIGLSPYQIMFGRDPRLPVDVYADEQASWQVQVDRVKYASLQSDRLRRIHQLVRDSTKEVAARNKAHYDRRHEAVEFKVGQKVMVYTEPRVEGAPAKLERKFRGPFTIVEKLSDVTYRVRHDATRKVPDPIHVARIARFYHQNEWRGAPARKNPRKVAPKADNLEEQVDLLREITNLTNHRVFIEKSGIPGAGWGLFARRDYSPGQVILEYKGERLSEEEFRQRYPEDVEGDDFVVRLEGGDYVDAKNPRFSSPGRFANCPGRTGRANILAHEVDGRIYLVADQTITAGQELLWDYGESFRWKQGERKDLVVNKPKPLPNPPVTVLPDKAADDLLRSLQDEAKTPVAKGPPAEAKSPVVEAPPVEVEPNPGPLDAYKLHHFFVAYDDDEQCNWVGQVVQVDEFGEFLFAQVYGTYDDVRGVPFEQQRWAKAYLSGKDNKAVFSNKAKVPSTWDPWLWKVLPDKMRSPPFPKLVKGRIPPDLDLWDPQ